MKINMKCKYKTVIDIHQNDVKNLILDRDLLINKFEISDKQYQYDIVSFTT